MVYCIDRFIVCELSLLYIKSRQIRFIHVTDKSGETGTVLFLKAGGTAGIQAEVAEEDPAPERQFVFPGLFSFIGNYVL